MNEQKKIAVYCASSTQIDERYFQDARKLGQLMAEKSITLVNGAGNMGLMAESANGCLENGGQAIGVIPTFMVKEGWCHDGMTEIIETADMHERQAKMAEISDAGIFLPGGIGTFAQHQGLLRLHAQYVAPSYQGELHATCACRHLEGRSDTRRSLEDGS